jgi:erythrin-vacuolar iron transport family protein
MKSLSELSGREVIALAIANEEEDSRIYQHFADRIRPDFPASAEIFDGMAEEERAHRNSLYGFYRSRFGEHLPPIRREDVRGFLKRRAVWWSPHLDLDHMRR